jgi:hypothetical protein
MATINESAIDLKVKLKETMSAQLGGSDEISEKISSQLYNLMLSCQLEDVDTASVDSNLMVIVDEFVTAMKEMPASNAAFDDGILEDS